jgi:hypothetical protein
MPLMPEGVEIVEVVDAERGPAFAQKDMADKEIEQLLSEIGSGARVRIQRVNPETGVPAHVGEIPADGFSLETLMDTFGGGRYHLRVFVGKDQKGGRIVQEIDPAIPPKNPRAPKIAMGVPVVPEKDGLGIGAITGLIAAMGQSQLTQMQMMNTVMTMASQQSNAMITAVTSFMTARPDKDPTDLALKMVAVMKEGSDGGGKRSTIDEIKSLLEVADMVGGGRNQSDGTMDVVREGIRTVGEIVRRAPVPVARPVASATVAKIPVVSVTPLPANSPTLSPVPISENPTPGATRIEPGIDPRPWVMAMRPHLSMLRMAVGQLSTVTAAELISERLEEEAWNDLIADIVIEMESGSEISPATCLPFARRASVELGVEGEPAIAWVSRLASEVLTIENESLEDDGPDVAAGESDDSK